MMNMVDAVDNMVNMENILCMWNIVVMPVMVDIVAKVGMVNINDFFSWFIYLCRNGGMWNWLTQWP